MTMTITWYDPKTRQKQSKTIDDDMRADMFRNKLLREGKRVLTIKKESQPKEKSDAPKDE